MHWTRTSVVLLGLLAALGVAAQWSPAPAFGVAWGMLCIVALLVVLIDGWRALRWPLRVVAGPPLLLPLGRAAPVPLVIANDGRHAVALAFRPGLPAALATDERVRRIVVPPGTTPMPIDVRGLELGTAHWESLRVRVRGPLGAAWWERTLPLRLVATVMADSSVATPALSSLAREAQRQRLLGGTGIDLVQLRDYRAGDAVRHIDWKATARSERLTVRQFSRDEHREIVLMIDVGRRSSQLLGELSRLGHFANVAARLVALSARSDDRMGLIAYSATVRTRVLPLAVATHAAQLHRAIGALRSDLLASAAVPAVLELQRLVRRRALVLFLADLEDTVAADELVAAATLIAGKHQVLLVDLADPAVAALASADADEPADVYRAMVARQQQSATGVNLRRLAHLGCRAVQVPPATASDAVSDLYLRLRAASPG